MHALKRYPPMLLGEPQALTFFPNSSLWISHWTSLDHFLFTLLMEWALIYRRIMPGCLFKVFTMPLDFLQQTDIASVPHSPPSSHLLTQLAATCNSHGQQARTVIWGGMYVSSQGGRVSRYRGNRGTKGLNAAFGTKGLWKCVSVKISVPRESPAWLPPSTFCSPAGMSSDLSPCGNKIFTMLSQSFSTVPIFVMSFVQLHMVGHDVRAAVECLMSNDIPSLQVTPVPSQVSMHILGVEAIGSTPACLMSFW